MDRFVYRFLVVIVWNLRVIDAVCNWPAVFQNSQWLDNTKGVLSFTTNSMTGYSFPTRGITIATWNCHDDSKYVSDGYLILQSVETFSQGGKDWNVYYCMQLNKITDVSYYYYHLNPQQQNEQERRLYIGYGTIAIDTLCTPATGATGSAFHVLVKEGSEDQAKITCPAPFLGRFDYTYTDGATGTKSCTTAMHLDVCTDKTTLNFRESCSQSIAYASGNVSCVASLEVNNSTFVVVYNPEATVDNSTTYRFACFSIASDSSNATVVYKNCTDSMTPNTLPLLHDGTVIGGKVEFTTYVNCQGGCTWPAVFAGSTWLDNTRDTLQFATDTATGWSFTVDTYTISNWECLDTSTFASDGTLLIKSTDVFNYLSNMRVTYMCLKMTKVTDYSYYYYHQHPQQANAAEERIKVSQSDTLTTQADICNTGVTVPEAEFHVMVKSGSEGLAIQTCPTALQVKMDYAYTGADTTTACVDSVDEWDGCSNRTIMTFDYTLCSQQMAYSVSGEVWCMVTRTIGNYQYAVVYNTDSSLTGTAKRFSCFVAAENGSAASMVYDNCTENQTPWEFAKSHDGTNIGALLTMNTTDTCPTDDPPGESTNLIPIIVGAVVGVLGVAAITAVTVYCVKKKTATVGPEKPAPSGPVANGHAEPLEINDLDKPEPVLDNNPALTANPEPNALSPIPNTHVSPRNAHILPPIPAGQV